MIPINSMNMEIDGGFSTYMGNVLSFKDSVYTGSASGFTGTKGNLNSNVERSYMGGDLQFYFGDVPMLGGISIRGEGIMGKQPGKIDGTESPKTNIAATSTTTYVRNFIGGYGMLVQNIDPINSQFVVKYDMYDPNSDIAGKQVTTAADMQFTTIGLGLVYHWDSNIKLTAYYDMVSNEEIAGTKGNSYYNDNKAEDDVFTFRIQYKF